MASLHRHVAIIHPRRPSPGAVPSTASGHDNISTPVTPDHRFRSRPLRNNSAKVSPHDHAPPAPPNQAYTHPCSHTDSTNYKNARPATPSPELLESSPGLSSPSGLANIRIRRPHHGSLLQSPGRAGHAARMRQIFEHASREQQTPQPNKPLLYPQLPNVSRKASPPLAQPGHVHNHCQETSPAPLSQPVCMSTTSSRRGFRQAHVVLAMSEPSSESWSDDSSYLLMESRISKLAPVFVPDDRISEWLTSVSTPDGGHVQDHDALDRPEPCQNVSSDLSDTASSRVAQQPLESRPVKVTRQDVTLAKDHTYTRTYSIPFKSPAPLRELSIDHQSTESPTRLTKPFHSYCNNTNHQLLSPTNDEIQFSPFSPNVCIERGPSRYYSSRNAPSGNRASPTKIQYTLSKENFAHRNCVHAKDHAPRTTVLDAPCKVGVGTRFQHPSHTPNNRQGRWTRHVEQ